MSKKEFEEDKIEEEEVNEGKSLKMKPEKIKSAKNKKKSKKQPKATVNFSIGIQHLISYQHFRINFFIQFSSDANESAFQLASFAPTCAPRQSFPTEEVDPPCLLLPGIPLSHLAVLVFVFSVSPLVGFLHLLWFSPLLIAFIVSSLWSLVFLALFVIINIIGIMFFSSSFSLFYRIWITTFLTHLASPCLNSTCQELAASAKFSDVSF
ncbi:hypothetical protein TYRP_021320 [Tyrophagus putrescentiae]|nr:hypothetical protein TYRP_021320 [Tyrophagus putrescentiae]